jgi:hypothetical protein
VARAGLAARAVVNLMVGYLAGRVALEAWPSMPAAGPAAAWPSRSSSAVAVPSSGAGRHPRHGLGDKLPSLFDAVTGHFHGDPEAACHYLIDQHPAGWSVLHGDFTAPPGYRTSYDPQDLRNQCYCHGDRHEPHGYPSLSAPPAPPTSTTPTC